MICYGINYKIGEGKSIYVARETCLFGDFEIYWSKLFQKSRVIFLDLKECLTLKN